MRQARSDFDEAGRGLARSYSEEINTWSAEVHFTNSWTSTGEGKKGEDTDVRAKMILMRVCVIRKRPATDPKKALHTH